MSTWGHSSAGDAYVIFCVGSEQRTILAFRTWINEAKIPFKSLAGFYHGQHESSFIIPHGNFSQVSEWVRDQDSVLVLGPCDARDRRPALLTFKNGNMITLGMFYSCSRTAAHARSAWTYDPSLDKYFITEHQCQPYGKLEWGNSQRQVA